MRSCLGGLRDWYAEGGVSGARATCHALECAASHCVLFDTVPDSKQAPAAASAGTGTGTAGAPPADTACYRRSQALPWSADAAPSPPTPPSPPPPPSPLAPLACGGHIELTFPDITETAASLGDSVRGASKLPESFLSGTPRCDGASRRFYEGTYSVDPAGRLAGTTDGASRGLLVGGQSKSSYLWWRPSGLWSPSGWADDPQNSGGWVITDAPPKLARTPERAREGASTPSASTASTAPRTTTTARTAAAPPAASTAAFSNFERLLPPDQQPQAARQAVYHLRSGFGEAPLPIDRPGLLWWSACGEHVFGHVKCAPPPAESALPSAPAKPGVVSAGCSHLQLAWQRSSGSVAREELEFRIYFAPDPATTIDGGSDGGGGQRARAEGVLGGAQQHAPARTEMYLAGSTSETTFELLGLAPSSAYLVSLAVRRGGRWSGQSDPLRVSTLSVGHAERGAPALLRAYPASNPAAPAAAATGAGAGAASKSSCSTVPFQMAAMPDCHAADVQEIEISHALGGGGYGSTSQLGIAAGHASGAAEEVVWSEWTTAVAHVGSRQFDLPVPSPYSLFRIRVKLHADTERAGEPSPSYLVDRAHEPLLGTPRWPLLPSSGAVTYFPTVRALDSGSLAVHVPPHSPCRGELTWDLLWERLPPPPPPPPSTGPSTRPSTAGSASRAGDPTDEEEATSSAAFTQQRLPQSGRILLEAIGAGPAATLVAKSLRCPHGCTFQLLPHNLRGWVTPSAKTPPLATPPLRRPATAAAAAAAAAEAAAASTSRVTLPGGGGASEDEGAATSSAAHVSFELKFHTLPPGSSGRAAPDRERALLGALRLVIARAVKDHPASGSSSAPGSRPTPSSASPGAHDPRGYGQAEEEPSSNPLVELLESRFGAEYLVLAVPRAHESHAASALLRVLSEARHSPLLPATSMGDEAAAVDGDAIGRGQSGAGDVETWGADAAEALLRREIDPIAGLIQILDDGTPVRRVLPGASDGDSALGIGKLLVLLCLAAAGIAALYYGSTQLLFRGYSRVPTLRAALDLARSDQDHEAASHLVVEEVEEVEEVAHEDEGSASKAA